MRWKLVAALVFAIAGSLTAPGSSAQTPKPLPYLDPDLPVQQRVDDLVSRLTLDEKVSQLVNTSVAIPRLGIPAYDWWSEGLHGIARSGYSTLFPQAIGMAATWDAPLVGRIGETVSVEARAKNNEALRHDIHSIYYGLTIWSPNINIFRDPRWGRGQETYGEDPFLTSRLGVAFVKGLQGDDPAYFRVIATPKHYAVHSGPESERHRFDVDPSVHDLWDTYLPAFRATIVEGQADSIMCAYNAIDKSPACANKQLLQAILRGDWKFGGFVTSDCGAVDDFFEKNGHGFFPDAETAAAAGIRAGTDTNCGTTYRALTGAVQKGLIGQSEIDVSVKRLFLARYRLGLFDPAAKVPYAHIPFSEVNSPAHHSLALQAARESMVLLKNDDRFLPLKPGIRTIAVVGPNAASLSALEGNYNAIPRNPALPVEGITAEFPTARILYAQGSPYAEGVALPAPRTLFRTSPTSGVQGLKAEYFNGANFTSRPVITRTDPQIDFDWASASPAPGINPEVFAVRWTGAITVPQPGTYTFGVRFTECYPCTEHERFAVYLDGKLVGASPDLSASKGRDERTPHFTLNLPDTRSHSLRVEYTHTAPLFGAGIAFEWIPPTAPLLTDAVAAARQADVVLAFVGLTRELEGEEMPLHVEGFSGGDRTDIKLPAAQQQLLEALAATGKPLVVILLNGSALAVNWAQEHAQAILEAWYPGESGGTAIAETLSGKNNPGGRLPVTFYASIDQLPAFRDYTMSSRTYRYFKGKPLYGFGYGLSYTTFAYSGLKLSTTALHAADPLTVEADVKNTGSLAGDEVAELYLTPPQTSASPALALAAFTRLHLTPGETRHVTFTLNSRTLSEVDEKGIRAVTPGSYQLAIGGAQPTDGRGITATFTIEGTEQLPR